jgi:hypothetical protein
MTIFKALNAVKRDLGAVSKDNTMKGGSFSYKYRSIDDVLNKLHPILVEHGVVGPVPNVIERNQNGKKTVIISGFTFFHTDGSSVTGATVGEGDDPGDKGANKASTGALKTFLTQTLAIPFDTDDPDNYPSQTSSSTPTADRPKAAAPKPAVGTESTPAGGGGSLTSTPSSAANEKLCGTCSYAIGASDPLQRKAGKYHHKACLTDGKAPAKVTPAASNAADDISSIIDDYPTK